MANNRAALLSAVAALAGVAALSRGALAEDALASLGDAALDVGLDLHPSCAVIISDYPILSIWRTNKRDVSVREIDATADREAVLVVRPMFEVGVHRIDTATFASITAIAAAHPLDVANEIATSIDDSFDLGPALSMLFRSGAVVGTRQIPTSVVTSATMNQRTVPCAI